MADHTVKPCVQQMNVSEEIVPTLHMSSFGNFVGSLYTNAKWQNLGDYCGIAEMIRSEQWQVGQVPRTRA
jgi:hypothetical protein